MRSKLVALNSGNKNENLKLKLFNGNIIKTIFEEVSQ